MYIEEQYKYMKGISRQYPGLFVILLDQSGSMSDPIQREQYLFTKTSIPNNVQAFRNFIPRSDPYVLTKADVATAAVNMIINEIVKKAGFDQARQIRKRSAYVIVLGYNEHIYPLLSKSPGPQEPIDMDNIYPSLARRKVEPVDIVSAYDSLAKGTMEIKRFVPGPAGWEEEIVKPPPRYWIKADARGQTHMGKAFQCATAVVQRWLDADPEPIPELRKYQAPRREGVAPVVINITDAQDNGGIDPLPVVNALRQIGTTDGEVLVYNCHFTKEGKQPIRFPESINEVSNLDSSGLAINMFNMSSCVPVSRRETAKMVARRPIGPDNRCYVYNADPDILVEFLLWGTVGQGIGAGITGAER